MFNKIKEMIHTMLNKYTSITAKKSFADLMKDYDLIKGQFEENYLPEPQIMSDGRMFIRTIKRTTVYNVASQTYISGWILLDKNYVPYRQSEYEFAELPSEGYLLKLRAVRPYMADSCNVDYLINLEEIRLNQSAEDMDNIRLIFFNEDFPMTYRRTSTQDTHSIPLIDIRSLWETYVYPKIGSI